MRLDQLYRYLDANIDAKIYPIMIPVDEKADCITYNLEALDYDQNFESEDNFYQARVTFICVSKLALDAITQCEALEGLLTDFQGFFVSGGLYVQDTRLLNKQTMYDDAAKSYGVALTVQFTYNT